jgi:methylmalonyl-CoA mutase cobalamin-binding domain/chain
VPSPPLDALCARFLEAQLEGDRAAAVAVIEEALRAGISVPAIHLDVIQAAQHEIGRRWETNAINVAMEHQATAIAQLALAAVYDKLPRLPPNQKRVLVACVEGELHDMGARISADFLEMEGFDVRLLGASVPPRHLAEVAEKTDPHLIALSATMAFHLPAIAQAVRAIRESKVASVPILVGGRAFAWAPGAARELDVQGFGGDAHELVREARRLVGSPS